MLLPIWRRFGLILIICLTVLACGNSDDSVRGVAHKYLNARLEGKFEEAKEFVTDESKDMLDELATMAAEFTSQPSLPLTYKIKTVEDSGRVAFIIYDIEGYGEERLDLAMKDGSWKVVLSPQSVPDAGILMRDLQALEQEDSSDISKETFDQILMDEGAEEDWVDSAELEQ